MNSSYDNVQLQSPPARATRTCWPGPAHHDSFDRPDSPLPLPADSVIRRHRQRSRQRPARDADGATSSDESDAGAAAAAAGSARRRGPRRRRRRRRAASAGAGTGRRRPATLHRFYGAWLVNASAYRRLLAFTYMKTYLFRRCYETVRL